MELIEKGESGTHPRIFLGCRIEATPQKLDVF